MSGLEKPWERQTWEGPTEWAWFLIYLHALAPRQLHKLARKPGCPYTLPDLQRIAQEAAWRERAYEWDAYLAGIQAQETERVIRESAADIAERHATTWQRTFRVLSREVKKLDKQSKRAEEMPLLSPRELFRGLDVTVRNERIAMGENVTKPDAGMDLSKWGSEDLELLRELMDRNR